MLLWRTSCPLSPRWTLPGPATQSLVRRSASLKSRPAARSWDFPNAGTSRFGVRGPGSNTVTLSGMFQLMANRGHKCRRLGACVMPLAAPGRLRSFTRKTRTVTAKCYEGVVVRSIKVDAEGRQATGSLVPSAKDGARKENARMAAFSGGSKSC